MTLGGYNVDFTTEELIVLSQLASTHTPFGLDTAAFDSLPDALRDVCLQSAERSLLARRILQSEGDVLSLPAPVATLMSVLCAPGLVGVVVVQDDDAAETEVLSATPQLGVQHRAVAPSVHRLEPFPTRELLVRVLDRVDLRPAPTIQCEAFTLAVDALEGARRQIQDGDIAAAQSTLGDNGVQGPAQSAFVEALRGRSKAMSVTLLHRPESGAAVGGSLAWLDAGRAGLWITEPVERASSEGEFVSIQPASADHIAGELLGFLPEPFKDASSDEAA